MTLFGVGRCLFLLFRKITPLKAVKDKSIRKTKAFAIGLATSQVFLIFFEGLTLLKRLRKKLNRNLGSRAKNKDKSIFPKLFKSKRFCEIW
jgi:hypothetical protein